MDRQLDHDRGDAWGMNQALVDALKEQGFIRTQPVEEAFCTVLRHTFLPGVPLAEVYDNRSIDIKVADGETLSSSSQPAIMPTMCAINAAL